MTNTQFAKVDTEFNLWCNTNNKKPSKRQASKYRNKVLPNFQRDCAEDFALLSMDCESSDGLFRDESLFQTTNIHFCPFATV